jgi:hypothetical protein
MKEGYAEFVDFDNIRLRQLPPLKTTDEIETMFVSSNHSRRLGTLLWDIRDFYEQLNMKAIMFGKFVFKGKQHVEYVMQHLEEPLDTFENSITKYDHPVVKNRHIRGGEHHYKLAMLGVAWLADFGFSVNTEARRESCFVDITDETMIWIVECGDTTCAPIMDHLKEGSCRYFAVLPFQNFKEPHIYVFLKGPGFDEYLRYRHEQFLAQWVLKT